MRTRKKRGSEGGNPQKSEKSAHFGIAAPVIRTNDTIIAKYKHFTEDNKASTKWPRKRQNEGHEKMPV